VRATVFSAEATADSVWALQNGGSLTRYRVLSSDLIQMAARTC
jgi:hypothetical protein